MMPFELTESEMSEAMFGLDSPGRCTSCGEEADGVEPDARAYICESCGEPSVYGLEELLIMGQITIID